MGIEKVRFWELNKGGWAGGVRGRQLLKSVRMLPFKMRSEMIIVLVFKPILDYLHENREGSLLVIEYVWEGWRSGWQTDVKVSRNAAV